MVSKRTLLLGAAALVVAAIASQASAAMVLDLRFADGSKTKALGAADAGKTVTVLIYAKVTGTDGLTTNDGLVNMFMSTTSQIVGTSMFVSNTAGFMSGATAGSQTAFNITKAGASADLNADGIKDVGSTSTSSTPSSNYISLASVNTPLAKYAGDSGVVGAAITGGYEFLVGQLTFTVGTFTGNVDNTSQVKINAVVPNWTGTTYSKATWYQDGTAVGNKKLWYTSTSPGNSLTAGTAITFTYVPEPATMGLILLGGLGLLARRNRRS